MNKAVTLLITLLLLCALKTAAQTKVQVAQVDALMKQWSTGESPGAAVLVLRDGRVLLAKGYGLADIESKEAITTRTVFDLASVSKQFTAMSIMLLAGRGRLSLDDALSKYFPELPAYARGVTIRNLLNHTSGVPDYPRLFIMSGRIKPTWQKDWGDWEAGAFQPTNADVLALLAAQQSPDFAAGERWAYSNSNYVLLALLVERVSGKSFPQFLKENIFQPLGMKSSFVAGGAQLTPKRATRYDRTAAGYKAIRATPFDLIYGDGNVHASVEDLAKWDQALYTERLVKAALLRQAFASGSLKGGARTGYGFGWVLDKYFGLEMLYHEGGGTGFNSFIMRLPTERFTVIVLSNFARFNPFITGRKLARIYIADKLSLPVAVKLAPEALRSYVGRYQFTPPLTGEVRLEGNTLHAQLPGQPEMTLLPLSETGFFVKGDEDTTLTFHKDPSGKVTGVTVLQVDVSSNGRRLEN
ncbi:MAG: serine hydrolase [Acidobacteria bacterium]|nr:serine hydrolase [Acidobacteriota bacterium]